MLLEDLAIIENLSLTGIAEEKAEWFSVGWHLKEMFDNGLVKDFSKEDFQCLKLVNKAYNRAQENKHKDEGLLFWLIGDNLASKLSDEGFEKIKDIYAKYIEPFISLFREDREKAVSLIKLKLNIEKTDEVIQEYS